MKLPVNPETWTFVGGAWQADAEGIVTFPQQADLHLAFYTERAFGEVDAEFEFRRDGGHCGVCLIVRAQDARRYYAAGFPFCGQQIREGHFWAAVTRADETGWARVLTCERVPGVPAEGGVWHQARVCARGDEIRLWVNGRPLPAVQDAVHARPGYVGLLGWGACSVRNLRLNGTEAPAAAWNPARQPVCPWFHPHPTADPRQGSSGLTRAPNGDLLLVVDSAVLRSTDLGRTWQEAWRSSEATIGTLAATRDGEVILLRLAEHRPFAIEVARSSNHGASWSAFQPVGEVRLGEAVDAAYLYGAILELADDGLLAFGYAVPEDPGGLNLKDGRRYRPAQVPGQMCFCLRSDDGGRTWSDPVNLDGPNPRPDLWMSFKDQASEVTAIETLDGEILAYNRPGATWAMWETRSRDGGRTWTPMATGPFLSYACAAPPRATASGALVIGGRFPALALRISRDQGITWDTYQIDTEIWAMGGMCEVAPDVVLWVYGSGAGQLRAQHFRITPDSVEPLLPDQR